MLVCFNDFAGNSAAKPPSVVVVGVDGIMMGACRALILRTFESVVLRRHLRWKAGCHEQTDDEANVSPEHFWDRH